MGEYQKQAWVFVGEIASISSQESEMSRFYVFLSNTAAAKYSSDSDLSILNNVFLSF